MTTRLSRRALIGSVGLGLAAATSGGASLAAYAQAKVKKSDVRYQDKPQGNQRCDACRFFQAPNQCEKVEGGISPNGWCALFAKKSG